MSLVEYVLLPAATEVNFGSGTLRVMLRGLQQDLSLGDEIEITLHFLHYPEFTVRVPVQSLAPLDESEDHH